MKNKIIKVSLIIFAIVLASICFSGKTNAADVDSRGYTGQDYLKALPTKNVKVEEPVILTWASSEGFRPDVFHESNTNNPKYQALKTAVEEITAGCTTDEQKAKAVWLWVATNVKYQYGLSVGFSTDAVYSIFENKKGNCEAYTTLTNYMLYLCNIPTARATGYGHAWSVAFINNKWINIDSTWARYDAPDKLPEDIAFSYEGFVYVIEDPGLGAYVTGIAKPDDEIEKITSFTIPNSSYMKGIYRSTFNDKVELKANLGTIGESFIRENRYCITVSGNQITGIRYHGEEETVEENRVEPTYTSEGSYDEVIRCSVCHKEIHRYKRKINRIVSSYHIAYDGNGATSGYVLSSPPTMFCGTTYTLAKNEFKREGYEFTGWNTKKDGTGTSYAENAEILNLSTVKKDVVTLYAQWKKVSSNVLLGDVNMDGKVNTKDAREVLLSYIGKKTLTDKQKEAADVNKDGKINTKDARMILLYYIGSIKKF